MGFRTILALIPLLAAVAPAFAQQTCNSTSPCGAAAPCCSEFGFCQDPESRFCLGGCNPLRSAALDSCLPAPICRDQSFAFTSMDSIVAAENYNGNASAFGWTVDKGNASITTNGELALILTETNGGTRISSTRYVHYGEITATLKTGKWPGVVTAFITMSDVHDEIDWEWPGAETDSAQSNFFWLGVIPEWPSTNGKTHNVSSSTFSNYHDYTINWQPNTLTFSIDGNVVRTVQKSDTKTPQGTFDYPTTPARVQFSLWPAGINGSAQGTIDWAGGMINWQDPDYVAAGNKFYALVKKVSIKCSTDSLAGAVPAGATGYVYGQNVSGIPSILTTNASTINAATGGRAVSTGVLGAIVAAAALAIVGAML